MSGIKENKDITTVTRLLSSPVVAMRSIDSNCSELEYELLQETSVEVLSPSILSNQMILPSFEKQLSIALIKSQMISLLNQAIPNTSLNSIDAVKSINADFQELKSSMEMEELKVIYSRISGTCIREHSQVFTKAVVHTVKMVMEEVGFSSVAVKQVVSSPVVIAKNSLGQAIRTEIDATSADGKINLVRIQSGIPESECNELNQRINASLIKHGMHYQQFCVKEKEKKQTQRTFDFSKQKCDQQFLNQQQKEKL